MKIHSRTLSALKCWELLASLQRTLHTPWDDHDMDERVKYGTAAQEIGGKWVDTLRAHVNKRIFYYYLHLPKAHLKEIIIATGHPFNGDDSVNEKGNQLSKRQKSTIFHGGSDAAGKRIQSYVRRRAIKGATATRRRARRSPSATASARTSARTRTALHTRR